MAIAKLRGKPEAGNPLYDLKYIACAGMMVLVACFAQAETIAYWPMVMNPATGGNARKIADASGNGYDLDVLLTDEQVANTDEIPFAHPPNGPTNVEVASCAEVIDGTALIDTPFQRGTGDKKPTADPLVLAMGLTHDFTLEGYMYVKTIKHGDKADTVIAFSGVGGSGDWIWNLTEPTANSNKRQVIWLPRSGDGLSNSVLATIEDSEIVGGWHHYALVFKFDAGSDKSQFTFYLDGVNRGSQTMAKRATVTQHDRFALGGIQSGACKVFNAKFAFWRVSDEALSPDAMLCKATPGTTVAYWPMKVESAYYDNAKQTIVPDMISGRNALIVRDPTKGGVSWTMNDIGWTMPPNPDSEVVALGIDSRSTMKVVSGNNTTKIDNQYRQVFSSAADAPVIAATTLTNNFTVEGYVKFTELPASGSSQMFINNTLASKGGWAMNLWGPSDNGKLRIRGSCIMAGGGSRQNVDICDNLMPSELLNRWNHYASTFVADNGNGKCEWRFFLNGHLRGQNLNCAKYENVTLANPAFLLSGCPSGATPSALLGDMTCWRVSKKALKPSALLCGGIPPVPADALVWKGSASTEWSTGDAANWDANGESVAWTDAKDAYFDDFFVRSAVAVVGEVNPSSITSQNDRDMTITFADDGTSAIGTGCTNLVKRGLGTLVLSFDGNKTAQLLKGSCPIEVREGCLKVSAGNSNGGLGDASLGYEVKVCEDAKLWINQRNAIGSATPDVANDSVFTISTNGTFDLSCAAKEVNIQALGALDLLGGDFIAPDMCHGLGYLMIRNRLTLGLRPDQQPYVFPAIVDNGGRNLTGGITIGRSTEFRVEDVTGDGASDGVFDCAVLARTGNGWQDAQNPCGFRKTGTGTMELNGAFLGRSGETARPTGVIAVEAGELKVNTDYRGPSKYAVADSAYLSGTGKVSNVEFAAGAGVRVDVTKTNCLEIADVDFAGAGVIELAGVAPDALATLRVKCARITGTTTGATNLANWKVKANGSECSGFVVRANGGFLKAMAPRGLIIVVQ